MLIAEDAKDCRAGPATLGGGDSARTVSAHEGHAMTLSTAAEVETTAGAWIDANWNPDLTVSEWWELLAQNHLSHPMMPEQAGGRGWSRDLAEAVLRAMADRDVLGPPAGLGMNLAAPTIVQHGTPEQIDRYVPSILNGQEAWCQLFSEPGAGSDLAGLETRAERDGDEWIVNGQKVWTSGGQIADLGMLVARTDADLPKHQGISYFACDMVQPGVEVVPLTEMTGRAMFNEVFLSDARVPDDALIGGVSNGWRVANTTLTIERSGLGTSSVPVVTAQCGRVAGNLERRAGDFRSRTTIGGVPAVGPKLFETLAELAARRGLTGDPVVRGELMKLYSLVTVNGYNTLRAKAGQNLTGGEGNIGKLMVSELYRAFREVGISVIGPDAMLASSEQEADAWVGELTLFSPGPSIYGGTDQIQRNIIGERVLGLAKEPGPARETPFKDLLK